MKSNKADVGEFIDQGYVVVRGAVPPELLEPLRQSTECLVRRQWPGGIPVDLFQPWVKGVERAVDRSTSNLVDFFISDRIRGVASQLMGGVEAAPSATFLMCNPVRDFGPWWWHRDVSPLGTKGPLQGLQMDTRANGPVHLHWNIAFYDDDVLWVVPGSHLRPNTEAENRQLAAVPHGYANGQLPQGEKRHEPLPGSVCVDLKAGDGVINHLELLHWASYYGPDKLRRTYHIGFRTFEGPRFFYEGFERNVDFAANLSPQSRSRFEHWLRLYRKECNVVETAFRALIDVDVESFHTALATLHPGEEARFVCVIHLCRIAQRMYESADEEFGTRFSRSEIDTLWRRFGALDDALRTDEEQYLPGLQIVGPSHCNLYDMPDMDLEGFVASWSSN